MGTGILLVLDVSPVSATPQADLTYVAMLRVVMVIYGALLYAVVQQLTIRCDSRTLLNDEIQKFLPLATKILDHSVMLVPLRMHLSEADRTNQLSVLARLREGITQIHSSNAMAAKLYTAASHAPYFGMLAPFPAEPLSDVLSQHSNAMTALDVLVTSLMAAMKMLQIGEDSEAPSAGRILNMLHSQLSPVLKQCRVCVEQQKKLVSSLESDWDAGTGHSPFEPLHAFGRFRKVQEEVELAYSVLILEELERIKSVNKEERGDLAAELIDKRLLGSISLIHYSLIFFCHSMERVGDAFERVAAMHPVMERAALRDCRAGKQLQREASAA